MGPKRGDFATDEEWEQYSHKREAMPRAAFQVRATPLQTPLLNPGEQYSHKREAMPRAVP
eukprot:2078282-Pyramimonas_sp.AAC.1